MHLLPSSLTRFEIQQGQGRIQVHRLTIDGESQQQFALLLVQLLFVDVVQQVTSNVSCPDVSIDWFFEKSSQAEIAIAQQRCQQGQGKSMTLALFNNGAQLRLCCIDS